MSDSSSIYKMICSITDYENWDHQIHENVLNFYKTHILYPNIMLASQSTWDKIDKYANENNPDNIAPPDHGAYNMDEEIKSISTFVTSDYSLDFCLDVNVEDDNFILVLDNNPVFDDETGEVSIKKYVRMKRSVRSVRHGKSRRNRIL